MVAKAGTHIARLRSSERRQRIRLGGPIHSGLGFGTVTACIRRKKRKPRGLLARHYGDIDRTHREVFILATRTHGLQSWIDRLNQAELPALAAVVQDLHHLAQAEKASVQQLADVLLRDASLTSKVLRVGNSVYYNPAQEPIRTISRAIV